MTITEQEFKHRFMGWAPNCVFYSEVDPYSSLITIYAFETDPGFDVYRKMSEFARISQAEAVWLNGSVIKDKHNLFNNQYYSTNNHNYSLGTSFGSTGATINLPTSSNTWTLTLPDGLTFDLDTFTKETQKLTTKCECGAHAVNSKAHSTWCPSKGVA